jgi:uncharacterized membrane protein
MSMRLQELHPAAVHFPIVLLPATLAADAAGRITGNAALLDAGRHGMAFTAASAALSGIAGLIAQEASTFDADAREMLITHRTLNLGLIGLTGWLAARRARAHRPGLGYLLAGAAGLAVMTYSAYLGGRMTYEHGVGVSKAGGLREEEAPHLTPDTAGEALRTSAQHVARGVWHSAGDLARGEVVPWLRRSAAAGDGRPAPERRP